MDPFDSEQKLPVAQSEEGIPSIPQNSTKTGEEEPTEVLPLAPSEGGNAADPEVLSTLPKSRFPSKPARVRAASNGISYTLQTPNYQDEEKENGSEESETPVMTDNKLVNSGEVMPLRTPDPEELFTINANGDTIRVRKNPAPVQNDLVNKKRTYDFAANGKWSMGFGMGVFSSYFDQRMPKTQGNTAIEQQGMVQRNQALREKMEKPGIAFSQSLWIQFQPHQNWSFNTGISMVQTTQNLAFAIKSQVPDLYRGPADFPEAGSTSPSGQYLFPEDSILPGSGYTATNKYFSREIPFYVNYHLWLNQKFQVQLSAGASYRWVTGASVYFADIDNVGMIYMNGPEFYPGLRGTWNIQGGVALNYQVNDYFSLNMMPGFQLALQSNIRHEHYVQQYQRQWGLQVRLSRKLGF
ncbi:MAG TPA: hypothetical protein DIW47_04175 [Bacteroidetes bacterium]|nr:hypothetical protein [Bacteroidota bacterium]